MSVIGFFILFFRQPVSSTVSCTSGRDSLSAGEDRRAIFGQLGCSLQEKVFSLGSSFSPTCSMMWSEQTSVTNLHWAIGSTHTCTPKP